MVGVGRIENLNLWPKGVTGNPNGRPKGVKSLKTRLLELMKQELDYMDLDGVKRKMRVDDALGIALMAKALTTGDIKAIEMIRNEVERDGIKEADLNEIQKNIVQRAMERMLNAKDVTPIMENTNAT